MGDADAVDEAAVKSIVEDAFTEQSIHLEQQANNDMEQLHARLTNETDALSARLAQLVRKPHNDPQWGPMLRSVGCRSR